MRTINGFALSLCLVVACKIDGHYLPIDADAPVDAPAVCPSGAPAQSGQNADLVLGQVNFTSSKANDPFQSGSTFGITRGLLASGNRLWASDSGNARVLQWNSLPAVNAQSANIVIGQDSMITSAPGLDQSRLATGGGHIFKAGNKLLVSDSTNNRVLIWDTIPTANGQPASLVLGQADFTTKANGNSAGSFNGPTGIWSDGNKLVVADRFNNRVLIWDTFPTTNGTPADVVLGQTGFNVSATAIPPTASSLRNPAGVTYDGQRLYVADDLNNRILVWSGIPTSNNALADQVIGQSGFDGAGANAGSPQVNDIGLSGPTAVAVDECGALYICDNINSRVMVYSSTPAGNAPRAEVVLGKPNFTTPDSASVPASERWMRGCGGLSVTGSNLFVADSSFSRVLRFALSR